MSDTPRTDAAKNRRGIEGDAWIRADFARELERELAQRTADLAKANAERDEAQRAACKSESRYFDRVQWPPPYKPCEDRILCRAKEIAAERGWDCFAPHANTTDVPVQNGGE